MLIRARIRQQGKAVEALRGYVFYVWKPDLEKIWPTAAPSWPTAAPPSERRTDDLRPPPRRREPVVTHDWFSICAEIARHCIDPKTGRVEVPKRESKLAKDVLAWCQEQGWQEPAVSEMREAVKRICAALRTAQK